MSSPTHAGDVYLADGEQPSHPQGGCGGCHHDRGRHGCRRLRGRRRACPRRADRPAQGARDRPDGSLYISDQGSSTVRRVDPTGIITTVAGTGQPASPATAALRRRAAERAHMASPSTTACCTSSTGTTGAGRRGPRRPHPGGQARPRTPMGTYWSSGSGRSRGRWTRCWAAEGPARRVGGGTHVAQVSIRIGHGSAAEAFGREAVRERGWLLVSRHRSCAAHLGCPDR